MKLKAKKIAKPAAPPADPLELLPPTQENLKPGRFYVPDGDYSLSVISHVDHGAITGIMLCGPHVTPGEPDAERLVNIKAISRLTVFDLADRLRVAAAKAEQREKPWPEPIMGFEVGRPEPCTCVGDRVADGQTILTAEQCADRFGGTADEWRAKWRAMFGMIALAHKPSNQ